jgi:hypothetical protein
MKQELEAEKERPDTTFRFTVVEEKGDEVIIEVSPENYAREMAAGVLPEETLPPGRHKFIRGGFRKRHPDFDSKTAEKKVRVNLALDLDVFKHFEARAAEPNAAPYQTQINQALREAMGRDRQAAAAPAALPLDDPAFLKQLAERVVEYLPRPQAKRKARAKTKSRPASKPAPNAARKAAAKNARKGARKAA